MSKIASTSIGLGIGAFVGWLVGEAIGFGTYDESGAPAALGIAIGAVAGAGIGYVAASWSAAAPNTLSPGTLPEVTLSVGSNQSASYCCPTGGTVSSATPGDTTKVSAAIVTANGSSCVSLSTAGGATGATTVTVAWTDASGASQTTAIPVSVTS